MCIEDDVGGGGGWGTRRTASCPAVDDDGAHPAKGERSLVWERPVSRDVEDPFIARCPSELAVRGPFLSSVSSLRPPLLGVFQWHGRTWIHTTWLLSEIYV